MNLFFLAIAPAVVIILYIYFKDKFEKEPWRLLSKNFFLGASLSIALTLGVSYLLNPLLFGLSDNAVWAMFIKAFIGVALVEEFSKYLVVRFAAQRNPEFNEAFDGIVYAVMVSMGFATLENILYVYNYGAETGILRAFTAVPAHASFGILMGFFMGKAKFSKFRWGYNMLGLLAATLFHGAYDFFLFIHWIPGITIGAFASLALGLFLSNRAIKSHQKNSIFRKDSGLSL
ncbi:MAG: PrsW family glutamic-type intramembrane protease [Bacteroidetes bacterium]|nr:PrsW family glutamic-type intramembrane protease [Bacteroidota bacterium]